MHKKYSKVISVRVFFSLDQVDLSVSEQSTSKFTVKIVAKSKMEITDIPQIVQELYTLMQRMTQLSQRRNLLCLTNIANSRGSVASWSNCTIQISMVEPGSFEYQIQMP